MLGGPDPMLGGPDPMLGGRLPLAAVEPAISLPSGCQLDHSVDFLVLREWKAWERQLARRCISRRWWAAESTRLVQRSPGSSRACHSNA